MEDETDENTEVERVGLDGRGRVLYRSAKGMISLYGPMVIESPGRYCQHIRDIRGQTVCAEVVRLSGDDLFYHFGELGGGMRRGNVFVRSSVPEAERERAAAETAFRILPIRTQEADYVEGADEIREAI